MTTEAAAEMRERVETLRSKAQYSIKTAKNDEQQAAAARTNAAECNALADEYEAILARLG